MALDDIEGLLRSQASAFRVAGAALRVIGDDPAFDVATGVDLRDPLLRAAFADQVADDLDAAAAKAAIAAFGAAIDRATSAMKAAQVMLGPPGINYTSWPLPLEGAPQTRARARQLLEDLDRSLGDALSELTMLDSPRATPYNVAKIRSSVEDISSYPMLTSDVSFGARPAEPSGGGYGGAHIERTVSGAIRQVIGRLPRYTDSRAFVSALTASFDVGSEEGHTVVRWRPRALAGGKADLGGGVTGAQASLYLRARDALAAVDPLLKGFVPLRADFDPQETEAVRSLVLAEFSAVVDELGTEGGPRAARVNRLFEVLLTEQVIGPRNVPVNGGLVGYLGKSFGIGDDSLVNTIEEEQQYSNFLLLKDWIESTRAAWTTFNDTYSAQDFGTRLVLLSRALQVAAEAVDEIEAAFDSVFVGDAERAVTTFTTTSADAPTMLISELLSWVRSFAAEEAPALASEGGRRGLGAVAGTATTLTNLVDDLINAVEGDSSLPDGARHPRVRHPLGELRAYLRRVAQLSSAVRSSRVS